jgi:hypothetical protein
MVAAEAASPQPTVPVGGLDPDQEIVRVRDGDAGHRHRVFERQRQPDGVDPADAELCAPGGGTLRNCPYLLRAVMASRFSQQSK